MIDRRITVNWCRRCAAFRGGSASGWWLHLFPLVSVVWSLAEEPNNAAELLCCSLGFREADQPERAGIPEILPRHGAGNTVVWTCAALTTLAARFSLRERLSPSTCTEPSKVCSKTTSPLVSGRNDDAKSLRLVSASHAPGPSPNPSGRGTHSVPECRRANPLLPLANRPWPIVCWPAQTTALY